MASGLSLLAIATLIICCEGGSGVNLRGIKRHHHSASTSSWAAYYQANNDDFNFWSEEWAETKTQLVRLALLNGQDPVKRSGAAQKSPSATAQEKMQTQLRTASPTDKLKMLSSALEYGTSRTERLKVQEQKSLQRFTEQEPGHKKRQADIDARYHNKTLIAQFYQSNTKEESRQWGSWQKQRERQQEQFQAGMKIQQGALKNAQLLADAYGKESSSSGAQLQKAQQSMKLFCHEAWEELQKQQAVLENALPASLLQI